MVTSQKPSEKNAGYCGSKSGLFNPVKEQRVNGNRYIKKMYLSCILTGFERNLQIKILSNQNCISLFREYSSISSQSSIKNPALEVSGCALHPWFISGFTDGKKKFSIRPIGLCHTAKRQYRKKALQLLSQQESTSLDVWGINLQSTVGERFSRKALAMVRLSPYTKGVIVGLILSDGWLIISNSTNARLGFAQSVANSGYFWYVFSSLAHYCSSW